MMDQMREEFERWVDAQFICEPGFASRHRYHDGYCQNDLNGWWKGWQAALSVSSETTE